MEIVHYVITKFIWESLNFLIYFLRLSKLFLISRSFCNPILFPKCLPYIFYLRHQLVFCAR